MLWEIAKKWPAFHTFPQRLLFSFYKGDILIELRKGTFLLSLHNVHNSNGQTRCTCYTLCACIGSADLPPEMM
jgi:hypothetical protein